MDNNAESLLVLILAQLTEINHKTPEKPGITSMDDPIKLSLDALSSRRKEIAQALSAPGEGRRR